MWVRLWGGEARSGAVEGEGGGHYPILGDWGGVEAGVRGTAGL